MALDLQSSQGQVFGPSGTNHALGLVPDPGSVSGTTRFLREDATWQAVTAASVFPTPTRAGDIVYWNGTTWVTLAGNNAGTQFLQETSAGVPSWAAVSTGGTLVSIQTFGASQTITIPAGATKAWITMWGGTGGSGGTSNATTAFTGCTGGAAALYKYLTGLTPGNTLNWTQGAAGAAGTSGGGNGGNGGASTLVSGTQTISTLTANGSNGTNGSTGTATTGSAGGTASGGDVNLTGSSGWPFVAGNLATSELGLNSVGITGGNFSLGAPGIFSSATATAGNAGTAGGLVIFWFT